MNPLEKPIYRFEDVEVDPSKCCVRHSDGEKHLRQQTFQVLLYLLERHERLVTKDELMEHIWQGDAVTDDALVQCVSDIRRALGDDPRRPRFIKTVPKVGYRFISPVEKHVPNGLTTSATTALQVAAEEVTTIEVEYEEEDSEEVAAEERIVRALPAATTLKRAGGKRKILLALISIALAALIVSSFIYFKKFYGSGSQEPEIKLQQVPGKRGLAVMYFENQSGGAELDWLREGLADMFITDLSRARNLNVLSRQQLYSLFQRIGHRPGDRIPLETAREVARRLRVDLMLMGRFASYGEKLRIEIELYEGENAQPLLSESLNVDNLEQLPMQVDLLAAKISARLGDPVQEQEQSSGLSQVLTNNLEAFRYYSLGLEKAQGLHNTEAIELLKKAIELDPEFAMAYARIGYAYAVTWNQLDEAKPYLEKAFSLPNRLTERDRLVISAWYSISHLDFPGAVRAYRETVANYPLDVEAYLSLGRLLMGEKQYDEAIDVFKRGLAVDAEAKDIYNALGALYITLGRHTEAIAVHQRYVQLAPAEPNAHDSLGLSLQWAGRYSEAIDAYNRALELKPDFEVARVHLGNTYFQMGRYREAISHFEKYIKIAPAEQERARGYGSIGNIYLMLGDMARAEEAARKTYANYDKGRALGFPIQVAAEKGDIQRAERLLALLENAPFISRGYRSTLRSNYFIKGRVALRSGRAEEAIQFFKDSIAEQPIYWSLCALEECLADAYLELKRYDEAIAEYERILRINPNYHLIHYHLAQAFEGKGQMKEARANYERFLEVWKDADRDIPEVVVARKRLAS